MERNSDCCPAMLEEFVVIERMMELTHHLLIETLDGRHYVVEKQSRHARQVVYLPMYEIRRTH